jgi:hypothetical protein
VPVEGVSTWYGAHCPPGVSNFGRVDTCTPFKTVAQGGRGGERIWYAAVPRWKWGTPDVKLRVCRKDDPTRCVIVVARDSCGRCRLDIKKPWNSRSLAIDLSPAAFNALAPLGLGVLRVTISDYQERGETYWERHK